MTDIAIGKMLTPDEIREAMSAVFAGLVVVVAEAWETVEVSFDIGVRLQPNESEFPCGLEVAAPMRPGRDLEAWLRGLAKVLGEHFGVPAICDGTSFGDTDSPYWSLVWKDGAAFLADDLDTTFADGEGGPVKIVRELEEPPQVPDRQALAAWVRGPAG